MSLLKATVAAGSPASTAGSRAVVAHERQLNQRLRQQSALVELAQLALRGGDLDALMGAAVRHVAEGLDLELVGVWELCNESGGLLLKAGIGWPAGVVGKKSLSAEVDCQLTYSMVQGEPISSPAAAEESRFPLPKFLADLGVVSGLTAPITSRGNICGLLAAHGLQVRQYREHDVEFLQNAVSTLGIAIEWHTREQELKDNQRQLLAGIVRDIVERRDVEHVLRRTEERYRDLQFQHTELERVAVAGEMAGIVAHEIRTPLNALSINVQLLERALRKNRPEDLDRAKGLVGTLRGEIDRINNLLKDYLRLLRRPSQHRDAPLLLSQAVQDAIRFVEPKAISRAIEIELTQVSDLPTLRGDEDHLRQVLLNLLLNAIQAMPGGGTICVSTEVKGDTVSLKIKDTGEGIASDQLARIFQPFVTTKEQGTGLGLAISERLIKEMGGAIYATSVVGEGACFEVRLPVPDTSEE